VSNIIRRYIDNMKFAVYMAVWFIPFFYILLVTFLSFYIWLCVLFPFNCENYAFLLLYLCIISVMYVIFCVFCFIVLFCVLFVCAVPVPRHLPQTCWCLDRSLSERHIRGMAGERHENGMVCVNHTRPHIVNLMGKAWQGNGTRTAWYV
jgi:hypothetical protein